MPLPNWIKSEDWDILRLGGVRLPGVAKVKAKLGSGLDVKKPKGGKKASIKDDGDPPGELDVELDMDHADVVAFAEIVPILRATTKDGAREPLKCEHPEAYLWGIHNVTVGDIDSDHPESGGRKKISFKLIEWAPAPAAVKASKKQPDDDAAGGWSGFEDDVAGTGRRPPPRPSPDVANPVVNKPSKNAGKNI